MAGRGISVTPCDLLQSARRRLLEPSSCWTEARPQPVAPAARRPPRTPTRRRDDGTTGRRARWVAGDGDGIDMRIAARIAARQRAHRIARGTGTHCELARRPPQRGAAGSARDVLQTSSHRGSLFIHSTDARAESRSRCHVAPMAPLPRRRPRCVVLCAFVPFVTSTVGCTLNWTPGPIRRRRGDAANAVNRQRGSCRWCMQLRHVCIALSLQID